MKILIITGGSSPERTISLLSASTVRDALEANGHETVWFDFKRGYGALRSALAKADAVFPVMHGKEGEDGVLYRFLRSSRMPYVGPHPKGAELAFNKIRFKRYCDKNGIPTPRWKTVKGKQDVVRFGFPCVLKATYGGSSLEVAILRSAEGLASARAKRILKLPHPLFVEEFVEGPEITVGVLHGRALPVVEIVPPDGGWFDYENKYSGASRETPFAPSISRQMQKRVQAASAAIHRDLKLGHYSRSDFIVEDGVAHLLETNTPGGVGLTPESLFPKAAKAAGMSFERMIEAILT